MPEQPSGLVEPRVLEKLQASYGKDGLSFMVNFMNRMQSGPEWSKVILSSYLSDLAGELFKSWPSSKENRLEEFRVLSKALRDKIGEA